MKSTAAAIEAILFVSLEPVSSKRLAELLATDEVKIEQAIKELRSTLSERGISLVSQQHHHQLVSSPRFSKLLAPLVEQAAPSLSPAMLEVLTIIAHRQPISRTDIEKIRGVSSEQTLKSLLAKALIAKSKQNKAPLEPIKYVTTLEFLRQAGLSSLDELTAKRVDNNG